MLRVEIDVAAVMTKRKVQPEPDVSDRTMWPGRGGCAIARWHEGCAVELGAARHTLSVVVSSGAAVCQEAALRGSGVTMSPVPLYVRAWGRWGHRRDKVVAEISR